MNNQLTQKYHYYLNESNKLNEELKLQKEYTQVLESIIIDLCEAALPDKKNDPRWKNIIKTLGKIGIGAAILGGLKGDSKDKTPPTKSPESVVAGSEGEKP